MRKCCSILGDEVLLLPRVCFHRLEFGSPSSLLSLTPGVRLVEVHSLQSEKTPNSLLSTYPSPPPPSPPPHLQPRMQALTAALRERPIPRLLSNYFGRPLGCELCLSTLKGLTGLK